MLLRIEKLQIQNAVNTSHFNSQHLAIEIKIGDETFLVFFCSIVLVTVITVVPSLRSIVVVTALFV
jgi:hypothetical protein